MGGSTYEAPAASRNYRKRPVTIQAVRYTGDNLPELTSFGAPVEPYPDAEDGSLCIKTLEDGFDSQVKHAVSVGDWVIRGVKGEYYACKPGIFDLTYEQAPSESEG